MIFGHVKDIMEIWRIVMRILLPKGEQQKFMGKILSKISTAKAAKFCDLSERTIRDWRRGKFLMDKNSMLNLCKKTNTPKPKNLKEKEDFWYANPYVGAKACIQKYGRIGGDQEYQKKKWYEWWNDRGRFIKSPLFRRKPIKKPEKCKELAEFIGIMLGDGGMTTAGQQIQITLNNIDDKEYINFVCKIIRKLFGRKPSVLTYKNERASKILLSSMNLVDYLMELGLMKGNKVKLQVGVPQWIKNDLNFSKACVRGLIDTDGCIFDERHKIKNKFYCYKRLNFSNRSVNLLEFVYNILGTFDLKPRSRKNIYVQIDSQTEIEKYFQIIGTSNPKHLKRYHK